MPMREAREYFLQHWVPVGEKRANKKRSTSSPPDNLSRGRGREAMGSYGGARCLGGIVAWGPADSACAEILNRR